MVVDVTSSRSRMSLGPPQKLFSIPLNDGLRETPPPYDLAPDGQRFLMNLPDRSASLLLVQGLDAIPAKR